MNWVDLYIKSEQSTAWIHNFICTASANKCRANQSQNTTLLFGFDREIGPAFSHMQYAAKLHKCDWWSAPIGRGVGKLLWNGEK